MKIAQLWIVALVLSAGVGCVTLRDSDPEKPPQITDDMSIEETVIAAYTFGDTTYQQAAKRFTEKKEWRQVGSLVERRLMNLPSEVVPRQVLQMVHLYQSSIDRLDVKVFEKLVRSPHEVARQAAWQLAASFPRKELVPLIDSAISGVISSGDEAQNFFPQLAKAVRANKVRSSYTFLRLGLMGSGEDEFARAMAVLEPLRATDDFMEYLSLANGEELRQITQKSVNVYACMYIMKHFLAYPVSVAQPNFSQLFYYAISRNNALSDLGKEVLQFGISGTPESVALLLSREPAWVQIAFIESVRRTQQPRLKVLVSELLPFTNDDGVTQEIQEVLR